MAVEYFPALNATLNGMATLMLLGGYWAIKVKKDRSLHRNFMVTALVCSALFLTCYVIYHHQVGSMPYRGGGVLRKVYFSILLTHIPLAILMVPFILAALYFALTGRFEKHVKLVKWVWPVWMYVSVTGVLIYVMLYQL